LPADAQSELARRHALEAGAALRIGEPLAKHTSFRIGGPADVLLVAPSVELLCRILRSAVDLEIPVTILGGGTNVLVSDRGVRGLVVKLGREFEYRRWAIEDETALLDVGAAARLARIVADAVLRGYGGIEFAAGIPGSVGGGALMNAGAFGGELGTTIDRIDGVSLGGERRRLVRTELEFSYRKLALPADVVVTSVQFRLSRSPAAKLRRTVQEVQAKRRSRQPSGFPNAGSIFKNPAG
jgi:UDP-N-acetylmuramate dehydrogenase